MLGTSNDGGDVDVFDVIDVPAREEDFSRVRDHLATLGLVGSDEVEVVAAIEARPAIVAECVERVRILRVNRASLDLYRADSSATLQAHLGQLIGDGAKAAIVAQLVAICAGRAYAEAEGLVLTLDREPRTVQVVWRALPGCERSYQRVLVTTVDITERMRAQETLARRLHELEVGAEEELRHQVALSDAIIRSLPAIFYVFDESGRFVRWNRRFETTSGYSADEIATLHPVDLFQGAERELIADRIAQVFDRGQADIEATLVTKAGAQIPFFFTGVRCELEEGGGPCVIGVGIDMTSRRAAEGELRNLSLAIEASGDVVFITDQDGIIRSINDRFSELYGYTSEEVIGHTTPRILKSGHQSHGQYQDFWRTVTGGELFRGELINRGKHGREVVVDETVSPFFDSSGEVRGFLAIQRDITERRRIEKERTQLSEQLTEAQKHEALGRLAGGVAHDFNNLLTVIICSAELLLDEPTDSAAVEAILDSGDRARALTSQLLAFSRRQVLAVEAVDVNYAIREMEPLLRRLLGEHIEMVVELLSERDTVLVDRTQLERVVINLAVNAREAMRGGGRLSLITDDVVVDQATADLERGRWLRLSVADNGSGMDAATIAHIFEPFYSTKERGSGLGLATVFGIVKQSGGVVRVNSAPGSGTRFDIFLPETVATASAQEASDVTRKQAVGGGEAILLVEDDSLLRGAVARILEYAGYRVTQAQDGKDALVHLDKGALDYSLVIADVVMPNMGGVELAAHLARRQRRVEVLLLSGHSADVIGDEHPNGVSRHFLAKPFTTEQLTATVRQLLEG